MLNINGLEIESNISRPLQKSLERKYYVGSTPAMSITPTAGTDLRAYGEVRNPIGSGVNLHINAFTVTSTAENNFSAFVVVDSAVASATSLATNVASANRASPTTPEAKLRHLSAAGLDISEGIKVFSRRMAQVETLVSEEDGKFIVPPGDAFGLITGAPSGTSFIIFAFGWWEQPI